MLIVSATDAPSDRRGVRVRLAIGDARIDRPTARKLCDPLSPTEPSNGAAREALVTTSPDRRFFETRHGVVRFKTAFRQSLSANLIQHKARRGTDA